jgi:hypothetical protein
MLNIGFRQGRALVAIAALCLSVVGVEAQAQARQSGTVKSVDGTTLTLTTATGGTATVTVPAEAKVLSVPADKPSLTNATPATFADISVGDKVLASGAAGDAAGSLTAVRVILMKSSDIEAKHQAEQMEWQRGLGGIVKSVDGTTITVSSGAKILTIETAGTTIFRKYAEDSVNFADSVASALPAIHAGDQLRARGTVAEDRLSMTAKEVVTGTFENLSGLLTAVNAASGTITLKDLATRKTVTVSVTAKSDLRNLPAAMAPMFVTKPAGAGAPGAAAGAVPNGPPAGGPPAGGWQGARAGGPPGAGGAPSGFGMGGRKPDLSQMLSRFPATTLAELKVGQAVMVVASEGKSDNPTAITLLSGVEPILSATPAGTAPATLSPWSISEPSAEGAMGGGGGPPGGGH